MPSNSSVSQEQLLALLRQRPFQPFRLHLTDGRVFEILSPRLGMACRTLFSVGVPDKEEPERYADHFVIVDYTQIQQVEMLPAVQQAAP
jgi:hypothetical protein